MENTRGSEWNRLYVQIVMIHVNMNRKPLCGLRVNLLLMV